MTAAGALLVSAPAIGQSEPPGSCFTDQPGTVGTVDHPTEPDAVVLRMSVGGGFVPFEIAFLQENPTFTLYGNDVVIYQPASSPDAQFTDAWPAYLCAQLSPEQVDELLTFALEDGGLADARDEYLNPNIVDVPTTTFTIDAAGVDRVVAVHALGFDMAPEEDADARAGFQALADLLTPFEAEGAAPFDVPGYAALLTPRSIDPEQEVEAIAWPWPDLTLDDFPGDEYARHGTLTPDQAAAVTTVPNGGQILIPITGPDGAPLSLTVRPILPDTVVAA
jgi:hypothetical protein